MNSNEKELVRLLKECIGDGVANGLRSMERTRDFVKALQLQDECRAFLASIEEGKGSAPPAKPFVRQPAAGGASCKDSPTAHPFHGR